MATTIISGPGESALTVWAIRHLNFIFFILMTTSSFLREIALHCGRPQWPLSGTLFGEQARSFGGRRMNFKKEGLVKNSIKKPKSNAISFILCD